MHMTRRSEVPPEETSAPIVRLLKYDGPMSAHHALVRFVAEKTVDDLPNAAHEEHRVFMHVKLHDAHCAEQDLDRLAGLDQAVEGPAAVAADASREARFDDADTVLVNAEEACGDDQLARRVRSARADAALAVATRRVRHPIFWLRRATCRIRKAIARVGRGLCSSEVAPWGG